MATPRLMERLAACTAADLAVAQHSPIALRDRAKRDIPLPDTEGVHALSRDVEAHNAWLANFRIAVDHPDARLDPRGFLALGDGRRLLPFTRYHRVFNIDLDHGGRWYGPWWQSISRAARAAITIDGEPTVELDFKCCHPRLLAAMAGLDLPFNDPSFDFYGLPGFDRRWVKLAFNIAINAPTARRGRAAAREHLGAEFGEAAAVAHSDIENALDRTYPALSCFRNTGIGLRLQNIDADICARVSNACAKRKSRAFPSTTHSSRRADPRNFSMPS